MTKTCENAIQLFIVFGTIAMLAIRMPISMCIHSNKHEKLRFSMVQIKNLGDALNTFRLDTGRYPSTEEGLAALIRKPPLMEADSWQGPYLKKPTFKDPWANLYQYVYPSQHGQAFDIYSLGPDGVSAGVGEDPDDINNWSTQKQNIEAQKKEQLFSLKNLLFSFFGVLLVSGLLWFLLSTAKCLAGVVTKIIGRFKHPNNGNDPNDTLDN